MTQLAKPDSLHESLQNAVAGRFWIESEIARGGMGAVFLARDLMLERKVAIKVLLPDLSSGVQTERFLREARLAAGLWHPNVVPVHSVEQRDGLVFFVMAYVDGQTLRELVEREGPLSPAVGVRVIQDASYALSHAHERGVIHRDVKPDNIMMERASGRTVVTDFGIAFVPAPDRMTAAGELIGTPHYLSPEQATGGALDPRSDLYSLGATAFFALTGRPPFEGASVIALLTQHATERAPSLGTLRSDLPRRVVDAIDRCLSKAPEDRPASAEVLARDLGEGRSVLLETPVVLAEVPKALNELCVEIVGGLCLALPPLIASNGERGSFFSEYEWITALTAGIVSVGLVLTRIGDVLTRVRAAARAGYSGRALEGFLKNDPSAPDSADPRAWKRWTFFGFFALVIAAYWLFGRDQWLGTYGDFLALIGALILGRRAAKDALTERTWLSRLWRGLWVSYIGRGVFSLFTTGVPRRAATIPAHGQTEVILGAAVSDLIRILPGPQAARLAELPELVARLEHHAGALRRRRDELDAAISNGRAPRPTSDSQRAGNDGVDAMLRSRSADALRDMASARTAASERLVTVLTALDTIRLDLVRLRVGLMTEDELTVDLEMVRTLGREVDALLFGRQEVTSLTAPSGSSHRDDQPLTV